MKNFALVNRGGEYFLAPAYDLINTCIHIQSGSDPCRLDFERFADRIGLPMKRAAQVLDMFMQIPQETYSLIDRSFLNNKMKRTYRRVIEERLTRYIRQSE